MAEELFSQSLASSQKEANIRHKIFRKLLAVFVTITSSSVFNFSVGFGGGENTCLHNQILFLRLSNSSLYTKKICLHMDDYTDFECVGPI